MNTHNKVVTRMAPSPTGKFHVGGVRTALYNYLHARKHNGTFIIRSEDTDKERSKKEYEDNMLAVFDWLGLEYDAFYRQSERTDTYISYIQKLVDKGSAYEAESSKDNPEAAVIRFKNPNIEITFDDAILGSISFNTEELGDFVIARTISEPLYHLTVVVDDHEMGITHVIRGQEHVNNTARQILIQEALGFDRPVYAHIPLIMSPRGGKLSKRDPEVIPALEYRDKGYLKEALINFLAYIGWNPGDDRELITLDELVQSFDINRVQKGGGVFNIDKLNWLNKQYLAQKDDDSFMQYLEPLLPEITAIPGYSEEQLRNILPVVREKITMYDDIHTMIEDGELGMYFKQPQYDRSNITWKKSTYEEAVRHLTHINEILESHSITAWTADNLKAELFPYADQEGRGDVLWPLRYALSGRDKSPDPFTLLGLLGKEESLRRIQYALEK
jgi:glutamyl-tRNA synthetase